MNNKESSAFAKIKRTALSKIIKQLKVNIVNRKERRTFPCELTLIKGFMSFTVPGATLALPTIESIGTAKVSFELLRFASIVNSFKDKEILIRITKNLISINSFSFKTQTTLFEDDRILRSIMLPANYSDIDLLSIVSSNRYTIEELKFNKLWVLVNQAENRMQKRVNEARHALQEYGITKKQIEALVDEQIRLRIESENKFPNPQEQLQSQIHHGK